MMDQPTFDSEAWNMNLLQSPMANWNPTISIRKGAKISSNNNKIRGKSSAFHNFFPKDIYA